MTGRRFVLVVAAVCILLALRFVGDLLPRPLASPLASPQAQCADSPFPAACKVLVGGTAAPVDAPPDMRLDLEPIEGPAISEEPVEDVDALRGGEHALS